MEYTDLQGRVIVRANPPKVDEPTEIEVKAIRRALTGSHDRPVLVRLDDGTLLIAEIIIEGDGEGAGLVEAAGEVFQDIQDIGRIENDTLDKLRAALARIKS